MLEGSSLKIDSKEEFFRLLQNMYCTEECFEGMQSWVGKILSDEEYRGILAELAGDSKEHKESVEDLISKIEGIEPKEKDIKRFDFEEGDSDEKILKKVLENDHSALYHYSLLRRAVSEEFLSEMMDEEDIRSYYETLDHLIEEEIKHIRTVRSELE